mgnify:CR=1 FL=1
MNSSTRVLITGATSGLGRELAVQLGRRGWRVAVTGRRRELLDETAKRVIDAGGQALTLYGTVTEDDEVKAHYAAVKAAWGGLDWAVLNAGVSDAMDSKKFSAETVRWTFDANVLGVARWVEAVLPDMLEARSGMIAGVASLAGFRGLPQSGPYSASKAAVISLLESMRVDLRGTGVDVVTVCPGFVKSEMTDRNEIGSMPFLMETGDGVAAMLAGLDARRRVVHFPWQLSYPTKYVLPALPDFFYEWFAGKMAYKRKKKPAPRG